MARPGTEKTKSRADKVPDPKHRWVSLPVFKGMRWNSAEKQETILPLLST
jgi:hypothetical protein